MQNYALQSCFQVGSIFCCTYTKFGKVLTKLNVLKQKSINKAYKLIKFLYPPSWKWLKSVHIQTIWYKSIYKLYDIKEGIYKVA